MDIFPSRLRQLRKLNKLTQEQLGKKVNVSKVSISGYESGNRFPDLETILEIADFFGVTLDYLMGRSEDFTNYSEEEKKLLKEIDYLKPEDLINKFPLKIGDRIATPEEIREVVEYIIARRIMKKL